MAAVALPSPSSTSLSFVPTTQKTPNPMLDRSQIIHTEPNEKGNGEGGGNSKGGRRETQWAEAGANNKEHSGRRGGSGGPEVACHLQRVGVDAISQRGS